MKKTILIMALVIAGMIGSASVAQARTLRAGSSGSKIRLLQSELQALNYPVGSVDGIYGSTTKAAVREFQREVHLTADGILGPQTQRALKKADRIPRQKTEQIVSLSKKFLGVPYVWGGTTPEGFDCSGFTRYVFAKEGITLPRLAKSQYKIGTPVAFHQLTPDDLVFFKLASGKRVSHVGIYIGKGKFISATSHKGIAIYGFTPYWARAYVGARRVSI
jgi:cell wall-associated NlpC family hydrolase